jgi:hypothetical protein
MWMLSGGVGCTKLLRADEASFAFSADADSSPNQPPMAVCDFVGDPLYLKADEPRSSAWFGMGLAASNNHLVVSAPLELASSKAVPESLGPASACVDRGPRDMDVVGAGRIRDYERIDNGWPEEKLVVSDAAFIHPIVPKAAFQGSLKSGNFATYSIASSEDYIVVGTGGDSINGPLRGSVRVFRRQAGTWSEQGARIQSPKAADNDLFGSSVALSGNLLVVGAPFENSNGIEDSGAAYVYGLTDSGFLFVQRLESASPAKWGWFGASVAISSDWIAVGAPGALGFAGASTGAVHLYRRHPPDHEVELPGDLLPAPGIGPGGFGLSIALSGDRLAVGAPADDCPDSGMINSAGAVYVYSHVTDFQVSTWLYPRCLDSRDNHSALFGWSVALNANTLVVGAPFSSGPWRGFESQLVADASSGGHFYDSSGSVYVFSLRNGGLPDAACRIQAPNTDACDVFGDSVAVADDYFAVGAPTEDGQQGGVGRPDTENGLMDSGAVYIYAMRSGAP